MTAQMVSIYALCLMFVVATIWPVNMGVLAFVGAFLVGTLAAGMSSKDIIACFSFYGPVPNDLSPVANVNGSIMGSYGALDTFVNPGIPKLEAAMKSAGKPYTYKIYEGANHAFFNDTGPRFNEAAAKDSWTRLVAYFKDTLAA